MYIWLLAFVIVSSVVAFIITLASLCNVLTDSDTRDRLVLIKSEYGIVSPLRMGALRFKKTYTAGYEYWDPITSTIMYGWPMFILQFFFRRDSRAIKELRKQKKTILYNKLTALKETGFDK